MRFHDLQWRVNPIQAKLNLAEIFREKHHLRDPAMIDYWVTKGYERLVEAELHLTYSYYVNQFLCPEVSKRYIYLNSFSNIKPLKKNDFLKFYRTNVLVTKDFHTLMKRDSRERQPSLKSSTREMADHLLKSNCVILSSCL